MDELVARLASYSTSVEKSEIEDVEKTIDRIFSSPDIDFYGKSVAISNLYEVIGSEEAIDYFTTTVQKASAHEIGTDFDIMYLAKNLLVELQENASDIYAEYEDTFLDIFHFLADSNFSDASMPMEEMCFKLFPDEVLRNNFTEISRRIIDSAKLHDTRKARLIERIVQRKETGYADISPKEIINDIRQSIRVMTSSNSFNAYIDTETFERTLSLLPKDSAPYTNESIVGIVAPAVHNLLRINDKEKRKAILDTLLNSVPEELLNKNFETITQKVCSAKISLYKDDFDFMNDLMSFHEKSYAGKSSEDVYQEQMRIIKNANKIRTSGIYNKLDFITDRVLAIPGDSTFKHFGDLVETLKTDLNYFESRFSEFFTRVMEESTQKLEATPEEEKLNIYSNIIDVVSNSELTDFDRQKAYNSIMDSIPANSPLYLKVLDMLNDKLSFYEMGTIARLNQRRITAFNNDPQKQIEVTFETMEQILEMDQLTIFEKEIIIGRAIRSCSPEVLGNNINLIISKFARVSQNSDFDFKECLNETFKHIISSDEYKASSNKQISLLKEIMSSYSKTVSKEDPSFDNSYTNILKRLISSLPIETAEKSRDELQSYVMKSNNVDNYEKRSIIIDIYTSIVENSPKVEQESKLLSSAESLANSRLLTSEIKQHVLMSLVNVSDAKTINSNIDSITRYINKISESKTSNLGSLRGIVLRKQLQAKFEVEPLDPLPDLLSAVDNILEDKNLEGLQKNWAITSALSDLPFDVAKNSFNEISKHILESNLLDGFSKNTCVSRLFKELIDDPSRFTYMFNLISNIPERNLSDFHKNKALLNIWQSTSESEEKYSTIKQYFESLSSAPFNKYTNPTSNFLELIEKINSSAINDFSESLIAQIDSINVKNFDKQKIYAELLLNLENSKENELAIQKYTQAMKRAGNNPIYDFSSTEALYSSIALESVQGNIMSDWILLPEEKKQQILDGIQFALNEKNPKLLDNPSALYFIEAVSKGLISSDNITKNNFKSSYSNLLESITPQRIDEYKALIASGKSIPEDKLEDFETQLNFLKIKEGKIPKEFYDYIIRENIRGNINKSDRKGLVMNAVTSLTQDHLEEMGINGYFVSFAKLDPYTVGVHSTNCIRISQDYLQELNLSDIVNTAFHESRHAYQRKAIENSVIDKKFYKMLKENIILDFDREFYDRNYSNMENEFDARVYGALKTNEYLLSIGLTPKEIAEGVGKSLEEELIKDKEQDRSIKKSVGDKERTIDEMVLEAINSNPAGINQLFKENPLLAVEYEIVTGRTSEGEIQSVRRKTIEQIEESRSLLLAKAASKEEQAKIEELFDYILNGEKSVDHSQITDGEYLRLNGYMDGTRVSKLSDDKSAQNARISGILAFSQECLESHTAKERYAVQQEMLEMRTASKTHESTDQEIDL